MAVGDTVQIGVESYMAVGRETTFGTYNTATAQVDFLSASLKMFKDSKILEEVARARAYSSQVGLGRVLGGDLEFYLRPNMTATGFVLQNLFGGTVTSATATGETAGGLAFTHTFTLGSMDQSYTSLCLNHRKGASSGQVFEYSGIRVNTGTFTGELDDAFKVSLNMMGKDASATSNDVSSAMTVTANPVLNFSEGRFSLETTFPSLTSTSFWHVQSMELIVANNLKGDNESRRIGSDTLVVLPPGVATFELKATIRFDTTTAYDAMLAQTAFSAEMEYLGDTLGTSIIRQALTLEMPKVRVKDAGDPEIGGPDEVLTSEVTFNVLRDVSSAGGYALRGILTNAIASLA